MRVDRATLQAEFGGEPMAFWDGWLAEAAGERMAMLSPQAERALARRAGDIAVIPINGMILAKPSILEAFGLGISTVTIEQQLRAAVADPEVKSVVLDVNSPGGTAMGVGELAAVILSLRESKPIIAHANHLMASAAYWLAASATQIEASPSALVGSIGVYSLHLDHSKMLELEGVTPTFIHAGRFKVDGNPYEPLSDSAREHEQSLVDEAYGRFVAAVATGRGVTAARVRADYGEGRVLAPPQARAAGMIDKVRTIDELLGALGAGRQRQETTRASGRSVAMARRRMRLLQI